MPTPRRRPFRELGDCVKSNFPDYLGMRGSEQSPARSGVSGNFRFRKVHGYGRIADAGLCRAVSINNYLISLVPVAGVEPATY
jgi:hypothetical protein